MCISFIHHLLSNNYNDSIIQSYLQILIYVLTVFKVASFAIAYTFKFLLHISIFYYKETTPFADCLSSYIQNAYSNCSCGFKKLINVPFQLTRRKQPWNDHLPPARYSFRPQRSAWCCVAMETPMSSYGSSKMFNSFLKCISNIQIVHGPASVSSLSSNILDRCCFCISTCR